MSETVILVEGLSKSYLVGHQSVRDGGYTSLRDVIDREAKNLARKTASLFRGQQILQGDEVEEFWALKDVGFEVKQGDILGIVGRNGAGKSTLLKILSRITEPTKGRVTLKGHVASLLEVGTGFHPELTGRENIYLNGAILGMMRANIQAKFDDIVAFAEVEKFIDTPVKRYSSGMYMRLAFAVAAHLEPEILVIDEVLAVGDAQFQKKCIGKMSDVAHQGRTVLFVSHNMVAVRSLCTRALLLEQGKIVTDGDVDKVIDRYLESGLETQGVVAWSDPAQAPGDDCVRLKSISVSCDGMEPGKVDIQKDFRVNVEYWVLQGDSRIIVSFHLHNAHGELLLTSSNMTSASETYDPWVEQPYPTGLYCTSCVFPGRVFNDGIYAVTVYINDNSVFRSHVHEREALKFEIVDTGFMREEYHGPWLGSLRMKLPWSTESAKAAEL